MLASRGANPSGVHGVAIGPADEGVRSPAPFDRVGAATAVDRLPGPRADDVVGERGADDPLEGADFDFVDAAAVRSDAVIGVLAGDAEFEPQAAFAFGRREAREGDGAAEARRNAGREAEGVGAAAGVEDAVDRRVAPDVVVAFFAVDRVGSEAASQPVVARPAFQQVVADPAEELVVARTTQKGVVAALAVDDVVAIAAFEGLAADAEVAAAGAGRGGRDRPGDDRVVPAPSLDVFDARGGDDDVSAGRAVGGVADRGRPFGAGRRGVGGGAT